MIDYLVIGKGLFGTAALRYLTHFSPNVAVIGPDEPETAAAGTVFASHYDQGRITGLLGRSLLWSQLAYWSIAQYRPLEAASGVAFYEPCGRLHVQQGGLDPDFVAAVQARWPVESTRYSATALRKRFPYLRFPAEFDGVYEGPPAGYINPRALIQAQLAVAADAGATIIRETAVALEVTAQGVAVRTQEGGRYTAAKALLATGAFSNGFDLLPRRLDLRVKSETIVLAEVPPVLAARLAPMPAVSYAIDAPTLEGIYLLPPIRYPDGRTYVKMGCNTGSDRYFTTLEAMRAWFVAGDTRTEAADMVVALQEIVPELGDLGEDAWQMKRCIVTYTATRHPYIDAVVPGRLYVAVGGNGTGAHPSDAVGRVAVGLMATGEWPAALPRAPFQAHFAAVGAAA